MERERDINEVFDDITLAENRYQKIGFTRGFSLGEETGYKEGYALGLQRGAQIASEIGFYKGFAIAWMIVLEGEETAKLRKINALKSLQEMTENFPHTNIQDDESVNKLIKIRAKFKQVISLLNVETEYVTEMKPSTQTQPRPDELSF
ncbi:protein LTO1 homolog [Parasteatoda tepidariorum]|nr:protein LTO1 homolog [Parasteatoda tepidariorum]